MVPECDDNSSCSTVLFIYVYQWTNTYSQFIVSHLISETHRTVIEEQREREREILMKNGKEEGVCETVCIWRLRLAEEFTLLQTPAEWRLKKRYAPVADSQTALQQSREGIQQAAVVVGGGESVSFQS